MEFKPFGLSKGKKKLFLIINTIFYTVQNLFFINIIVVSNNFIMCFI